MMMGGGDTYSFVRVGGRHACALDHNDLYCWGDNRLGQIGTTMDAAVLSPTRVLPSVQWDDVATGGTHTCALHDGVAMCWGDNSDGQVLGQKGGPEPAPVAVEVPASSPLAAIAAGQESSCAIDSSHGLWCWGNVFPDMVISIPSQVGTDPWSAISVGTTFACGIQSTNGGTVACWGENTAGEAQPGGPEPVDTPTPVAGVPPQAFEVVAGDSQACALVGQPGQADLYCWGYDGDDLLVPGKGQSIAVTKIGSHSDWSEITLGRGFACGIRGGQIVCWGTSAAGGFGAGRWKGTIDVDSAVEVRVADAIHIGVLANDDQGREVVCAHDNGTVLCWGDNAEGELGIGSRSFQPVPVQVPLPAGAAMWIGVGAGDRHTCGITDQGLYCWGAEDLGQVTGAEPGLGATDQACTTTSCDQPIPVAAPALLPQPTTDLVVGTDFTCASQNSKVTCWGNGATGELGTAMLGNRARQVSGTWTSLFGGPTGACVTSSVNPQPSCWGTFATIFSATPQQLVDPTLNGVTQLALADQWACGITNVMKPNERVCWGVNDTNQLGDGMTATVTTPELDLQQDLSAISAAGKHGCEVIAGIVGCWGDNTLGQTGQPDMSAPTPMPQDVSDATSGSSLSGCTRLSIAPNYGCAVCSNQVKCWGYLADGELGRPDDTTDQGYLAAPVELPAATWGEVATGARHACAVDMGHRMFCWGHGEHGEIGDGGHAVNVPTPLGPRAP
jgi:alpha-tubulin suppressor-like RCC1 family protein